MKIPLFDYTRQWHQRREEVITTIQRVFDKGQLVMGSEVQNFETDFIATLSGVHGIAVNSGTDALIFALRALGIGSGDEVLTTPLTAVPTVSAIRACGAVPVFIDVSHAFLVLDLDGNCKQLLSKITPKTKAVVAVHLHGQPVAMETLCDFSRFHNLAVIEDCAQSYGASIKNKPTGSFGDVACFSFYPTKNLGAYGDGGLCATSNIELAEAMRSMRMYGFKYDSETGSYSNTVAYVDGFNSRLDEVQAALLRLKLVRFQSDFSKRLEIAAKYLVEIKNNKILLPQLQDSCQHGFHIFAIRTQRRDELRRYLQELGISTGLHYGTPLHLMPAFQDLGYSVGDFPQAEKAAKEMISIPIFPELSIEEQDFVIHALNSWGSV